MDEMTTPKVFISYAWGTPEYNKRVLELSIRLAEDGIEALLDQYELVVGADKYSYMERMVNDENVNHVLILCNEKYKRKSDAREGGVGDETTIISKEVYERTKNTYGKYKFIPIIFERNEEGESFVPAMLESKVYLDMSSQELMNENFESLVRIIFDKPSIKKPLVGKIPRYLSEGDESFTGLSSIQYAIESSIRRGDEKLIIFNIKEYGLKFLNEYFNIGGIINNETRQLSHEDAWRKCSRFAKFICEFVDIFDMISDFNSELIDIKYIHSIIESMITGRFSEGNAEGTLRSDHDRDHLNWMIMFFTTLLVAIFIKRELFDYSYYLIKNPYLCKPYRNTDPDYYYFNSIIGTEHTIFDSIRRQALENRFYSNSAKLILESIYTKRLGFNDYIDADLYISIVPKRSMQFGHFWIPYTSLFRELDQSSFVSMFKRLKKMSNLIKFSSSMGLSEKDADSIREVIRNGEDFKAVSSNMRSMMMHSTIENAIFLNEWGSID
jgi:hypothetical protein